MNEAFNYKDYEKYSSPGEYKEATKRNGILIPLQFFIAVSNIMKKRHLSFGEACKLLEEKRYLIWQGKTAIYDLRGDSLWK